MNYKTLAKMFGYLLVGIEQIMDTDCNEDDKELTSIILTLWVVTNKAIEHCESKK